MSSWQITQKPAYLTDFIELNKNLQQAVINALRELEQDPLTPRGNTIKTKTGYTNVYRYRLGDFRLIYAAAPEARMINLLAIGPRGTIYQRFDYPGWNAPETIVEFSPELVAQPEWMAHPEWFQSQTPEPAKEGLPRKLTPALLGKWRIDNQYHESLMRCLYADDLLNIPDNKVPAEVLGRVMDALYPATVERLATQPDHLLFDPEDLARYAEGTLSAFLLRLDEQQQQLTHWALTGPTLVKGGPGSGKSTVALYRLRALVAHHHAKTGQIPSVLFTTYTNALINSSQSLLRQLLDADLNVKGKRDLPKEIRVTTLHKTAAWIARRSGQPYEMANDRQQMEALHAARAALQPHGLGDVAKIPLAQTIADLRDDYLLDEFAWVVEGQNCRAEADYLAAIRVGRGIAFTVKTRQAVWALYEAYRAYLAASGFLTWGALILMALDEVKTRRFSQRWDYVLVDEAQDLPPAALALAIELCREPGGVFLTADANQSLYNQGFRWRAVHEGLNVSGRTRILHRNYRSTHQIAAAAAEIMSPTTEFDGESLGQEYIHAGPRPVLYAATGSEDQARWIAGQIIQAARQLRLPVNAAAVLVASSSVGEPLAQALSGYGLPARFMSSQAFDLEEPSVKVTTLHAAKGLEFPIVVVAHVEAGRLPRETAATDQNEIDTHILAQRRLFYVGCTRAMRHLFVTYDRQLPSSFLADLSEAQWHRLSEISTAT
jgi:superfamily I DNA/RNA helicase/mRNA-degrading endonuclease RelE of RelBE toxin-antitoxin system